MRHLGHNDTRSTSTQQNQEPQQNLFNKLLGDIEDSRRWTANSAEYEAIIAGIRNIRDRDMANNLGVYSDLLQACDVYLGTHQGFKFTSTGRSRFNYVEDLKRKISKKISENINIAGDLLIGNILEKLNQIKLTLRDNPKSYGADSQEFNDMYDSLNGIDFNHPGNINRELISQLSIRASLYIQDHSGYRFTDLGQLRYKCALVLHSQSGILIKILESQQNNMAGRNQQGQEPREPHAHEARRFPTNPIIPTNNHSSEGDTDSSDSDDDGGAGAVALTQTTQEESRYTEEAASLARQEAERRQREEAARLAMLEEERRQREEAARQEAERRQREEAERQEAARLARQEEERRQQVEAERQEEAARQEEVERLNLAIGRLVGAIGGLHQDSETRAQQRKTRLDKFITDSECLHRGGMRHRRDRQAVQNEMETQLKVFDSDLIGVQLRDTLTLLKGLLGDTSPNRESGSLDFDIELKIEELTDRVDHRRISLEEIRGFTERIGQMVENLKECRGYARTECNRILLNFKPQISALKTRLHEMQEAERREEAERQEAERRQREAERQEAERRQREAERQEAERRQREEAERQEAERRQREEAERQEAERRQREEVLEVVSRIDAEDQELEEVLEISRREAERHGGAAGPVLLRPEARRHEGVGRPVVPRPVVLEPQRLKLGDLDNVELYKQHYKAYFRYIIDKEASKKFPFYLTDRFFDCCLESKWRRSVIPPDMDRRENLKTLTRELWPTNEQFSDLHPSEHAKTIEEYLFCGDLGLWGNLGPECQDLFKHIVNYVQQLNLRRELEIKDRLKQVNFVINSHEDHCPARFSGILDEVAIFLDDAESFIEKNNTGSHFGSDPSNEFRDKLITRFKRALLEKGITHVASLRTIEQAPWKLRSLYWDLTGRENVMHIARLRSTYLPLLGLPVSNAIWGKRETPDFDQSVPLIADQFSIDSLAEAAQSIARTLRPEQIITLLGTQITIDEYFKFFSTRISNKGVRTLENLKKLGNGFLNPVDKATVGWKKLNAWINRGIPLSFENIHEYRFEIDDVLEDHNEFLFELYDGYAGLTDPNFVAGVLLIADLFKDGSSFIPKV